MSPQNSLKSYARQAKKRLASGYWQQVQEDRTRFLTENISRGENEKNLKHMYQKRLEREIFSLPSGDEDEKFYRRVCLLLSSNECVLNPIKQLIDHSEYDSLDEQARQIYLFKLTDKYNEMRQRWEREVNNKFAMN